MHINDSRGRGAVLSLLAVAVAVLIGANEGCGRTTSGAGDPATEGDAQADARAATGTSVELFPDAQTREPPLWPDAPDAAYLTMSCVADDGGVDAPMPCPAPPDPHCFDQTWKIDFRPMMATCDPGGQCLYEPVWHNCAEYGGHGCIPAEVEAGTACPVYTIPAR